MVQLVTFALVELSGVELVDQLPADRHLMLHTAGSFLFCVLLFVRVSAYGSTRRAALDAAVAAELAAAKAAEEARMSRVERMAALGQLAAGVAHEVNNPLTYLTANLGFIREALESERLDAGMRRELKEAAVDAANGIERIALIVSDLKTFIRDPNADDPTPCDAHAVVGSVLRLTEPQLNEIAIVEQKLSPGGPHVAAPEARLAQVLLNLVINAMQAFDPESDRAENRIRIETEVLDGQLRIALADNGCGMPPDVQARATEPGFTPKEGAVGTGLGLSVCNNIVESLGGRLELDSEVGRGTTVSVHLPVAKLNCTAAQHETNRTAHA